MEPAPRGRRILQSRGSVAVLLCLLVVLGFYGRSALSYGKSINPAPESHDFHNLVADSILAGQVSLTLDPPPGLLKLPDPYDANANAPYRAAGFHDLSLYKGHLYAYFGPTPALLAFVPFRILNVGDLSPTLATLIFCCIGFLFSYLLFRLIVGRFLGGVSPWIHCGAVIALGLATPVAWITYIGRAYEVSIACAYALLFVGIYLLARAVLVEWRAWQLIVGSASLGLAVGARPTMAVAALLIGIAAVLVIRSGFGNRRRNLLLAALIGPYAVIGVLLALYNYARFDSFFEFGQAYQLAGENLRKYPFRKLSYIPKGFYYYLFSPGRISSKYPYLYLRATTLDPVHNMRYTNEPVAGAITNMPATAVGYVLAAVATRRNRVLRPLLLVMGALAAVAILVLLLISFQIRGTTFRYELEFVPLLVLVSAIGWAVWSRTAFPNRWVAIAGHVLWIGALYGSVAFNLAIISTPCAGTGSC